jgi:hypothetical protein
LVVLQNPTDSENVRGLSSEVCPASSHDISEAISIKAEVLSDVEEEEDPLTMFPGMKAEPEVGCVTVHVRCISQIQVILVL